MKTSILSLVAIAIFLFVSCDKNENMIESENVKVLFTSVTASLQTRVGGVLGDEWTENDPIGIFMVNNGATTVVENASNILYKATTLNGTKKNATFTSDNPIYYPVNNTKVDFIAYHPYSSSLNGYVYPIKLGDQSNQSAIDLMTATAKGENAATTGYDKSNNVAVELKFTHKLLKVVLNVTAGPEIGELAGLKVVIKGMNTAANYNLTSDAITNQETVADIETFRVGSSNSFEAILLPVDVLGNSHIVEFTVGADTYKWTMTENQSSINKFEAGKKYTFGVTLMKNKVDVNGTVTSWTDGGTGTGIAR